MQTKETEKMTVTSLYDYVYGDKAQIEISTYLSSKKEKVVHQACELLLMEDSPLGRNISKAAYILSPEGLYYIDADQKNPVSADNLIAENKEKPYTLSLLPFAASLEAIKSKQNAIKYTVTAPSGEAIIKKITLKKNTLCITMQDDCLQYGLIDPSGATIVATITKDELGFDFTKDTDLTPRLPNISKVISNRGHSANTIDMLWKTLGKNNNFLPYNEDEIKIIKANSQEQKIITLHTSHTPKKIILQKAKPIIDKETQKEKINADKAMEKEQKISHFKTLLKNQNLSLIFRQTLRKNKAHALESLLYGNSSDELPETIPPQYGFPSEQKIKQLFDNLDEQHHFFDIDKETAFTQFLIFFKACKLIADYFEQNNDPQNCVAALHAYKMLVLFGFNKSENGTSFKYAEEYFNAHACYQKNNPLHDTLVTNLPLNQPQLAEPIQNLQGWRAFIQTYGLKAILYFQQAPQIEKKLNGAPKDLQEAITAAATLGYERYLEYPELAAISLEHHFDEKQFNKCLEIEKIRKKSDNLPDIILDGNLSGFPGYYLVKLPIDDPRAYILGEITNCCQSIGGDSEQCVIDGITRENNGFYVLLKRNKENIIREPMQNNTINYQDFSIVGQGYAWISQIGNLTFDSWENLRAEDDSKDTLAIIAMLKEFAKAVTEQFDFIRVTIGIGGKTPRALCPETILNPEKMAEGHPYGDSKRQALLYLNEVKQAKIILNLNNQSLTNPLHACISHHRLNFICADQLVSQKQADWIATILLLLNNDELLNKEIGVLIYNVQFIKILRQNGIIIWEVMFLLYQAGMLNKANFENFLNHADEAKTIAECILLLQIEAILNDTNYNALLNNAEKTSLICNALLILHQAGILDDDNRKVLVQTSRPDWAANGLIILHQAGILDDNNRKVIAQTSHPERTADSLIILHQAGILGNASNRKIIAQTSYPEKAAKCLIILNKAGILDYSNNRKVIAPTSSYPELSALYLALLFHKAESLLDANCQLLIRTDFSERVANALGILHKAGILDDVNRQTLEKNFKNIRQPYQYENVQYSEKVANGLVILHQGGILDDDNRQTLLNYAPMSDEIATALVILHQARILDNVNSKPILKADFPKRVAAAFVILHQAKILNDANRQAVLMISEHSILIANALVKLHQAGILDDINHQTLLKKLEFFEPIANALVTLHQAGILDDINRQTLLKKTEFSERIANSLVTLHQAGILDVINRKTLLKQSQYYYEHTKAQYSEQIANGLVILHQAGILDYENRVALVEEAHHSEQIARALVILHQAGTLSDPNHQEPMNQDEQLIKVKLEPRLINETAYPNNKNHLTAAHLETITSLNKLSEKYVAFKAKHNPNDFQRFFGMKNTLNSTNKAHLLRTKAWTTLLLNLKTISDDDSKINLIDHALTIPIFKDPLSNDLKLIALKEMVVDHQKGEKIEDEFGIYRDNDLQRVF